MNEAVNHNALEAVTNHFPARLVHDGDVNRHYGIDAVQWKYLTDIAFPAAKSQESIIMALDYCKARKLDIMKKPVHIVPMWSAHHKKMVDTVWPSINEYRTTAHRTGEYAGLDPIEHGPAITRKFTGKVKEKTVEKEVTFPEWTSCTCYRLVHGRKVAFSAKVYWLETYAAIGKTDVPNDMWAKRPYGQPDKCAEAAALRKAFPEELGSDYTSDEMHGREVIDDNIPVAVTQSAPTLTPPSPDEVEAPPDVVPDPVEGNGVIDDPAEILAAFEDRLEHSDDIEALEETWSDFQHYQETLPEDDAETLRGLYANAVAAVTDDKDFAHA